MKAHLCLTAFTVTLVILITCTRSFAQGELAPAGAPAPTMKSLQDIWERINANQAATESMLTEHRDATIAALQAENAALKEQNATIQQLLASLGLDLPWQTTTIDHVGFVGDYNSLSFDPSGNPAISYSDRTQVISDLKYASFDGQDWATQTIDHVGNVGANSSLSFDPSGNPAISYLDSTNLDLKYALFDGQDWSTQTIDHVGFVGVYTSLSFDPSGNPAISYYDETNDDLKYAFKAPFRGGR
jgi:hypothetical protein